MQVIALPSVLIAQNDAQIKALNQTINFLKGALSSLDVETVDPRPAMLRGLTQQQAAFVDVLMEAYPRAIRPEVILEKLPAIDHAQERQLNIITVNVYRLRKALGDDAIQHVRGAGYKLSAKIHDALCGGEATYAQAA